MSDEWRIFAAHVVAGGILLNLLFIFVIVTMGFRYAQKIEQRVAKHSGSLSSTSQIWSEALVGRLVSAASEHRRWATQMFRCRGSGKRGVWCLCCRCMECSRLFCWRVYLCRLNKKTPK
ncbi:hypothetical protein J3362_00820 [Marinobacter sp. NFXS11]|uniref:hypothetical protein n=1 Tax=Marinobacter sp. NFXS11 TaxID=2818432 RepID=UPI0032DEFD31